MNGLSNGVLCRTLQRRILETARDFYPEDFDPGELMAADMESEHKFAANLIYLQEHGLIQSHARYEFGQLMYSPIRITVQGIDFLADDGGVSAILNTVTFRLHADTIQQMIITRIEAEVPDPHERSLLRKTVETASEEALRSTTQKLVEKALESAATWLPIVGSIGAG